MPSLGNLFCAIRNPLAFCILASILLVFGFIIDTGLDTGKTLSKRCSNLHRRRAGRPYQRLDFLKLNGFRPLVFTISITILEIKCHIIIF